tara:strand:- start:630 stop:854 length:225 start_codon:yes stop_codon:yes gene_type:complete
MESKNRFEKYIRLNGMTKRRFGEITGLKGASINKYMDNPTMLRLKHLQLLAESDEGKFHNIDEVELVKMISNAK